MKGSRGMTLVELLAVAAIVSILSSVLFPAYAGAAAKSRQNSDAQNMLQILSGTLVYTRDFDDVYPLLRQGQAHWECNYASATQYVDCPQMDNGADSTFPYMKSRAVWASPNDTLARNDCPTFPKDLRPGNNPGGSLSYTFNQYGETAIRGAGDPYALGLVGWTDVDSRGIVFDMSSLSRSSSQVGAPADTVLLYPYFATFSYWYGQQAYISDGRRLAFDDPKVLGMSTWPKVDVAYFWCSPMDEAAIGSERDLTEFGFADGHVSPEVRTELMDRRWLTEPEAAIRQHLRNQLAWDGSYHR